MNLGDDFKNPGMEWRGKPFWSWNGRLQKEELIRQIHVMKEMGMGGFFMHSRTGLETEYLGDEWFDLINACADEAEKLGLEAWLYDEDRWPSGLAGGIVSQHPEFRQKAILLDLSYTADPADQVVGQWVARLDGA
ncbi:MAG: glycoside hydrolase, partial [Kiritimatiellales bacterium]